MSNTNNNNSYYKYNNNKNNNSNNNYKYNNNNSNNNINNNYKYNNNNGTKYNNYNNKYSKDNNYSNKNDNNNNLKNNNTFNNQNNKRYNYRKTITNNLKQYKKHIDFNKNSDSFNWDDIHNLIITSKIGMNIFIEELVESCKIFMINDDSSYYVDLYIKSIFNYYSDYLEPNDISDIKDVVYKHLQKLANNLNYDKNYYLEDIWVMIIYYLINNQILTISDFNIFSNEYNNIKKEIVNVLKKIVDYNYDTKNSFKKEVKDTKFYSDNKKLFEQF
jgi:hypothetical protein